MTEIVSNYDNIIGKLTIFSEPLLKNGKEKSSILERPVTPIEDEIKYSPLTLEEFLVLFRRRISLEKFDSLTEDDQRSLLGIVESEICLVWPQLISLLDYPFFDDSQNKEMRRSLFITIIGKCKDSFQEHREKFKYYNDKNIFSDEANLVRVKLQLAEDVKNKLHIPTLRRQMHENVARGIVLTGPGCCAVPSIVKIEDTFQTHIHDVSHRPTIEPKSDSILKSVQIKEHEVAAERTLVNQEVVKPVVDKVETVESISSTSLNDKILTVTHTIERHKFIKEDLLQLVAYDDSTDADRSDDPKSQKLSSIEYYKSINDELQKKIEILVQRNELTKKYETFVPRKPLVEQPSSVPRFFKNRIYFVSDIRPTPRRLDCDISLATNGPLWNELADEISPEIVKLLDSNLSRGEEVKDIYREIMKTVSNEHLSYTEDPLFERGPTKINVQEILSSYTLTSELKKERIINSDLKTMSEAPWKSLQKSRTEWEKPNYTMAGSTSGDMDLSHFVDISRNNLNQQKYLSGGSYGGSLASAANSSRDPRSIPLDNLKEPINSSRDTPIKSIPKRDYVIGPDRFAQGLAKMPRLMQDRLVRQYDDWYANWKNSFDVDDYQKYLSIQPTDFLSVIFHHFEDSNNDIDESDELYISPEILEQRHKMRTRELERNTLVQEKVQELEREKNEFYPGLWNPSSIFIGGLGKIPTISDEEIKLILKDKPEIENPDARLSKMSAYSRARSAVASGMPQPLFTKKIFQKRNSTDHSGDISDQLSAIQTRLERIWVNLKMPNHHRLDMTIKYSSGVSLTYIDTALRQWEQAVNLVVAREAALLELEKFERIASDPNRFFVKGYRGSSNARLDESKIRTDLQTKLDDITVKAQNAIDVLKSTCGDELTYGGRLYVDKIKWDRTEMLYWLQEERKEICTKSLKNSVYIK